MTENIRCTNEIEFRNINQNEIGRVYLLENEGFPEDEADSYDMLVYRQREAPDLLLGCYFNGCLAGFVCATRYHGKEYTKESMEMHVPNGGSVCIHSVVVNKEHRRKGIALKMLQTFVEKVKKEQHDVSRILLICTSNLIPLYTRAGFELNGRSKVVHGKDPWYELQIKISGR